MVFNVSEFQSIISREKYDGLSLASRFLVEVIPPSFLLNDQYPTSDELSFFCDTTSLPGRSVSTIDYKQQGFGDVEKIPVSKSFDSLSTTFFCDSQYTIMNFFQDWLGYIVQADGIIGPSEYGVSKVGRELRGYREIGYKEDYQTTINLKGFAQNGSDLEIVEYKFFEAYPTQIGAISMGWEQNDTIMRLPVEFAYTYYQVTKRQYQPSGSFSSPISLFTRLAQLGTIAGVISSVKRPKNLQDLINLGTTIRTAKRGLLGI